MASTLILIIILYLAAMVLILAEICTPTFGMLGVLAMGAIGWAVWLGYNEIDRLVGLGMLIASLIALPIYIITAVKILPKTRFGGRLFLRRKKAEPGEGTPEADELTRLVGRTAAADTVLRPSGTIRIDDKRIVAQAESGIIQQGSQVKILRAAGNRVIVRQVEET